MIYTSKVIKGSQEGRKIGFPTANLADPTLLSGYAEGVYVTHATIDDKRMWGMLYLGERYVAHETKLVLEINFFDFSQDIYGKTIEFEIFDFVRGPIDIKTFADLKKQLTQDQVDCQKIIIDKYSAL